MMERLVCVAIGYLFGLFQTAYIYGKLHGIDIRNYGSGNAGTTNTLRVLGTKAGLIVLAGDILKCILAIAAVRLLFAGGVHEDMYYLLAMYAALGAILGHDYPFYLGFKGGKGHCCDSRPDPGDPSGIYPNGCDPVFRYLPADALCFPRFPVGLCRIPDRNGDYGTDGSVFHAGRTPD